VPRPRCLIVKNKTKLKKKERKKRKITKKSAIITKNKVISINKLTYRVPQKSHATKELVSYKLGMSIVTTRPGFQKNLAMPEGVT
jgi:hypothetical protein